MKRYLLFDAGCAVCREVAQAMEEAAGGKLEAVSLRESKARAWLDQVYPAGWAYQPYLVAVDGERVRAYAGMSMALRLGWLLGPRKAWQVWGLARRYGVMLPGRGYSVERRGFLRRAALFVAGLFFFPRFGAPGEADRTNRRPHHPLEGIHIKSSRELKGEERTQAIQQALNSQDVRNVLNETGVTLEVAEAVAFRHELEGGNTLVAVGFPSGQGALVSYQLARPIDQFATWSWLYTVEETSARLVATSVNGRSVGIFAPNGVSVQSHCSQCTGVEFNFDCTVCQSLDWGCVLHLCALCVGECSVVPPEAFPACVLACCGATVLLCCTWGHGCCSCLGA